MGQKINHHNCRERYKLQRHKQLSEAVQVSTQKREQSMTHGTSRWDEAWLWSARVLARFVVLGTVLCPAFLWAQTNTAKTASPDRCLVIVDTSRAMPRRVDGTLNVVQELVISGLQRQFRPGDTFGLWTFNEVLHAGQFPLQVWSPESAGEIAARMVDFLKTQKYAKSAKFESVLPALAYVVERSERLTVVLLSSGEEKIQGTPFDQQVNDYFQRLRKQQQKTRMPFVVAFSVHKGHMINCTMNTPPWPLQLPAPIRDAQPAQNRNQQSQRTLQGKAATSAPPHTVAAPRTQTPSDKKPSLIPGASTTNKSALAAAVPTQSAKPAVVPPSPPRATSPPKVEPVKPKPAEPAVPKPASATSAPAVVAQSQPLAAAQPETNIPAPTNTSPKAAFAAVNPAPVYTSNAAAPPRPAPPASAPVAPAPAPIPHKMIWITAAAVVVAAAVFIVLRSRRRRPEPQGSLITRSYDRGTKQ